MLEYFDAELVVKKIWGDQRKKKLILLRVRLTLVSGENRVGKDRPMHGSSNSVKERDDACVYFCVESYPSYQKKDFDMWASQVW